jgi:hypothetical protein
MARMRQRTRVARKRSVQESLGQIVLGFEVVVVFLGGLVVFGLHALPPALALGGGAAVGVAMLVTVGLLRYRWGFVVGWALQLVVIAAGLLVGMFFVVGAIFTALWAYCMITGARIDRQNRLAASADDVQTSTATDQEPNETEKPE